MQTACGAFYSDSRGGRYWWPARVGPACVRSVRGVPSKRFGRRGSRGSSEGSCDQKQTRVVMLPSTQSLSVQNSVRACAVKVPVGTGDVPNPRPRRHPRRYYRTATEARDSFVNGRHGLLSGPSAGMGIQGALVGRGLVTNMDDALALQRRDRDSRVGGRASRGSQ